MKQIAIVCFLYFIANISNADAISNLQDRLNKINSFHSSFIQKVVDCHNNLIIQESRGELWLKRPNQFHWHVTAPSESTLISDGNILWFYYPSINQVTMIWLKNAIINTPFMLLFYDRYNDWYQYKIEQKHDDFILTPKNVINHLKKLIINISNDGIVHKLSIIEQDGQSNNYQFQIKQNDVIDTSKFIFRIPKNITIDDQRN